MPTTSASGGDLALLAYRRPAWLWGAAGMIAAPLLGIAPYVALYLLWLRLPTGGDTFEQAARADQQLLFLASASVLAPFVLASVLLGGVWAFFIRRGVRQRRILLIADVARFGIFLPATAALGLLVLVFVAAGIENGWPQAVDLLASARHTIAPAAVFVCIGALFVAPLAGAALAWIAFTRRGNEQAATAA